MATLQMRYLGVPEVTFASQPLKFATRKTLALLVYLVIEGGSHSREKLAALFWPESDASHSRASLRNTLGYLRTSLKPAVEPLLIERQSLGYNFESPFDLDVDIVKAAAQALQPGEAAIETLQAAVDAYRGDFLDGFSLGDSPEFDNWASFQREHWHHQIATVFDRLSQEYATGGNLDSAVDSARRWVGIDSFNEFAYQRLIQLHFAAGDRTNALKAYEACRAMLAAEFDAEPAPETEALVARVRSEEPRILDFPLCDLSRKSAEIPFVGRVEEHTAMVTAYHAARQGQLQVVVLIGEPGVGKTRLASEFLRWGVAQGADVIRGRAFETGGQLPYQAVTRALRARLDRENAPEDLLSDVWLAELSRLLPELLDRYPDLPSVTGGGPAARTRLFEVVARLGQALADRKPQIWFFDDLQWADTASLDILHYVAESWRESQLPILLLLSLRADALSALPELQNWIHGLEHNFPVTRLSVEPLAREDVQRLVDSLFINRDKAQEFTAQTIPFSQWLFDETDGQPFFIAETLKALHDRNVLSTQPDGKWSFFDRRELEGIIRGRSSRSMLISSRIRALIVSRLTSLSPLALEMLVSAAVLGQEFNFDHLYKVAGLEEREGLSALDELLDRKLISESQELKAGNASESFFIFSHDKIREVAYTEAGAARRRVMHRRAFDVLRATNATPAELAHHASHARLVDHAFRYSTAAGDEAMKLFAVRDAIAYYETALKMDAFFGGSLEVSASDRKHIFNRLGRAYELDGAWEQARSHYEGMLEYGRMGKDAEIVCQALNHLATVHTNGLFDYKAAADFLQQASAVAHDSGNKLGMAETEWNQALLANNGGQVAKAHHHAERALVLARQLEHPELTARSLSILTYINLKLRQWSKVVDYAEEARDYYMAVRDRALEADSLRQIGIAWLFRGKPREAINALREAYNISMEIENQWGEADGAQQLANGLLEVGAYGEALRLAQHAALAARATEHPSLVTLSLVILGKVQRVVLALEAARATQLEALAAQREGTAHVFPDWAPGELCAVNALMKDWESAYNFARQAIEARDDGALLPMTLTGWYETEALLRGGEEELARKDLQRQDKLIDDNSRYRIPYLRSLAILAQWDGEVLQSIDHLESALALVEGIDLPGERWEILVALGAQYQLAGKEEEAKEAFGRAAEIVHSLADTIDDETLKEGFLREASVRSVVERKD